MKILLLGSLILCLSVAAPVALAAQAVSPPSVVKKCVAGPNEFCPSDQWLKDYADMVALQKPYVPQPPKAMPKAVQDQIQGALFRLNKEIAKQMRDAGLSDADAAKYRMDDAKRKLVKVETPPPTPTPAAAPAPPPQPTAPTKGEAPKPPAAGVKASK
jgi:hypothetical protein